jgi:hypothetical protein
VKAQIPLLAEATFIIEKYCDLTVLKAEERVFPDSVIKKQMRTSKKSKRL